VLQAALLLLVCLVVGLVSVAACAWVALSGQMFTMDGLLLIAIALFIGGLFVGNVLWSVRQGEAREVLNALRRKGAEAAPPESSSEKGHEQARQP